MNICEKERRFTIELTDSERKELIKSLDWSKESANVAEQKLLQLLKGMENKP